MNIEATRIQTNHNVGLNPVQPIPFTNTLISNTKYNRTQT